MIGPFTGDAVQVEVVEILSGSMMGKGRRSVLQLPDCSGTDSESIMDV